MVLRVRSSGAQALGLVRRRANHGGGGALALALAGHRPEVTRELDGETDLGVPTTAGGRLFQAFSRDDPGRFRAHDGGEEQGDAEEVTRTCHGSFCFGGSVDLWHSLRQGSD